MSALSRNTQRGAHINSDRAEILVRRAQLNGAISCIHSRRDIGLLNCRYRSGRSGSRDTAVVGR
jgi:hypothetical protein